MLTPSGDLKPFSRSSSWRMTDLKISIQQFSIATNVLTFLDREAKSIEKKYTGVAAQRDEYSFIVSKTPPEYKNCLSFLMTGKGKLASLKITL